MPKESAPRASAMNTTAPRSAIVLASLGLSEVGKEQVGWSSGRGWHWTCRLHCGGCSQNCLSHLELDRQLPHTPCHFPASTAARTPKEHCLLCFSATFMASEKHHHTISPRELVSAIYFLTWKHHNAWAQQYASSILSGISTYDLPLAGDAHGHARRADGATGSKDMHPQILSSVNVESPEPPVLTSSLSFIKKTDVSVSFAHVKDEPIYEACTPLPYQLLVGDDAPELSFVPYSDDPNFDAKATVDEYTELTWQDEVNDPNRMRNFVFPTLNYSFCLLVDIIILETARRLNLEFDMPLEEIDDTHVFPHTVLTTQASKGLLHSAALRSMPSFVCIFRFSQF
jgi:hypothetical protein